MTGLQKSACDHDGQATHGIAGATITIRGATWVLPVASVDSAIKVMRETPTERVVLALDDEFGVVR